MREANLQQVGALPRPQATDVLDQALSVRVGDGSVHVHSHLIDTVDEFTVESREEIFLHHMFLREKGDRFFEISPESCLSSITNFHQTFTSTLKCLTSVACKAGNLPLVPSSVSHL